MPGWSPPAAGNLLLAGPIAGDARPRRLVRSSDFVQVFQAGKVRNGIENDAVWSTGDGTADGDFDSADIRDCLPGRGLYEVKSRQPVTHWLLPSTGYLPRTSACSSACVRDVMRFVIELMSETRRRQIELSWKTPAEVTRQVTRPHPGVATQAFQLASGHSDLPAIRGCSSCRRVNGQTAAARLFAWLQAVKKASAAVRSRGRQPVWPSDSTSWATPLRHG